MFIFIVIMSQLSTSLTFLTNTLNNIFNFLSEINIFSRPNFHMERYSCFLPQVLLNTNQHNWFNVVGLVANSSTLIFITCIQNWDLTAP